MSEERARTITKAVAQRGIGVKMNDLLVVAGSGVVGVLKNDGAIDIFADVKTYDTPDTVEATAKAWVAKGATVMTVHASGTYKMVAAAVKSGIRVYAVTIPTSFDEEDGDCMRIYNRPLAEQVRVLALEAKRGGAHGLICSAKEVRMLALMPELAGMELIVPGTRSLGAKMHDQKRSATAREAADAGATGFVFGREATEEDDVLAKVQEIIATLTA